MTNRYISLPRLVGEFLHRSDNGFPHIIDLHTAFFYMEFIIHAEANAGIIRKPVQTSSLNFERQDWLGRPQAVCVELPEVLTRLVAARDIEIDRSPMFPLSESRPTENHYLRYSRPVLLRKHHPLVIPGQRSDLMDKVIAHVCRKEHNEIGLLQWESVIRATAEKPGDKVSFDYSVLLRPPEPVTARERILSTRILQRRAKVLSK